MCPPVSPVLRSALSAGPGAGSPDQEELLPHERDERWVYVALAVLGVAFAAYAFRDSIDLSRVSFDWVKKVGGTVPYAFATLFGVFFQLWNRKRLERVRKKWEANIRTEGLLRQGSDLKVVFADGAKGSLKADVHLTRSAFYLFDRGGRREPMRFPLTPSSPRDSAVVDATLAPDPAQGARVVQVHIRGPAPFRIEFRTPDAEGWRTDLRRALGWSGSAAAREATAESEESRRE